MAIVCSFITSNNRTIHTHKQNRYTQNEHFTCQLNMSSICPAVRRLIVGTTHSTQRNHSRRRCHSPTLLSMNDCGMPRQSFVSVRQQRRNFDDDRPSAEGHPIDGIINRVQVRAIRWPYAGAVLRTLGPAAQPPSLCMAAPDF